MGKEYKIKDKYPFPKGKYEHPKHNILIVKNNMTFFSLLLPDQSIIFTFHWQK